MHPDIGDLIQGIKRSLSEEILPAIDNMFAREQLAYTLFLCEHLAARWDQAHLFVAEEYTDLRSTLAAAVEIGRRCPSPPASFTALVDATAAALAADTGGTARPLRALSATITELKRTLVQLLAACADRTLGDSDGLVEMRTTLHEFMKRQLTRDEHWVSTAQIGWW